MSEGETEGDRGRGRRQRVLLPGIDIKLLVDGEQKTQGLLAPRPGFYPQETMGHF